MVLAVISYLGHVKPFHDDDDDDDDECFLQPLYLASESLPSLHHFSRGLEADWPMYSVYQLRKI